LGEQFCCVGRKLLCGSPARLEAKVQFLQSRVEELSRQIRGERNPQSGPIMQVIQVPENLRLNPDPKRYAAQLANYRRGGR
jgi:hypothetical protein